MPLCMLMATSCSPGSLRAAALAPRRRGYASCPNQKILDPKCQSLKPYLKFHFWMPASVFLILGLKELASIAAGERPVGDVAAGGAAVSKPSFVTYRLKSSTAAMCSELALLHFAESPWPTLDYVVSSFQDSQVSTSALGQASCPTVA